MLWDLGNHIAAEKTLEKFLCISHAILIGDVLGPSSSSTVRIFYARF
jgi:hypothetical protein